MIGVGASLVLDEFAMIFHLQDVYWTNEGQLSVDMVTLATACISLAAVGVSPLNVDGLTGVIAIARGVAMLLLLVHLALVAVTALKGKYPTAMLGIFLAPIAWVAAFRLARPTSPWARWRYSPRRLTRARQRALGFDHRWARCAGIGSTPSGARPRPSFLSRPRIHGLVERPAPVLIRYGPLFPIAGPRPVAPSWSIRGVHRGAGFARARLRGMHAPPAP